jgi:MarR family 2-MHQ and catechol resistance regulon transcriptional repressor
VRTTCRYRAAGRRGQWAPFENGAILRTEARRHGGRFAHTFLSRYLEAKMSTTAAVTDREISLKLWVVLARAFRAMADRSRRDIERHGLTGSEFAVLEALHHKGDLPIGDLGDRVLLTSGSMTYVVDKLARRGLLSRRRCTQDQRVRYAAITPAGRRLLASIFPDHVEEIRRATAGLSAEEKRSATVLLKRLGLAAEHGP